MHTSFPACVIGVGNWPFVLLILSSVLCLQEESRDVQLGFALW